MKKIKMFPITSDFGKRKTYYKTNATKQEIHAALKLIELLYSKGEISQHIYRNICNDYYSKGIDIANNACYTITTPRQDAV